MVARSGVPATYRATANEFLWLKIERGNSCAKEGFILSLQQTSHQQYYDMFVFIRVWFVELRQVNPA